MSHSRARTIRRLAAREAAKAKQVRQSPQAPATLWPGKIIVVAVGLSLTVAAGIGIQGAAAEPLKPHRTCAIRVGPYCCPGCDRIIASTPGGTEFREEIEDGDGQVLATAINALPTD